jgi:hypothetical protein
MLTNSKIALSLALVLATASAALAAAGPAVGQNGYDAGLRQCVANLQASGRSVGSPDPEETGVTEYDLMVWHCQAQVYRAHASLPLPRPARTAKGRR